MRKTIAAIFAAALALGLSGCAPHTAADMYSSLTSVCGTYKGGTDVNSVTVSETADSKVPTVKFPLGIDSKTIETKVITEGKGPKITGDQYIDFEFTQLVGTTGKVAGNSSFNGSDVQSQYLEKKTKLCSALAGVREGSRVALLIPSSIMSAGEKEAASGVILFDITKVYLPHAVGDDKGNASGLPTVIRATTGLPTLQFPGGDAPTTLQKHVLIQGWGEEINADRGQKVMMHYSGWVWNTKVKFDSSWDNGRPVAFDFATNSLIEGMVKGLDGQKVGTQIMLVIPPSLGYKDKAMSDIPANSTLIFVVDILGVTK